MFHKKINKKLGSLWSQIGQILDRQKYFLTRVGLNSIQLAENTDEIKDIRASHGKTLWKNKRGIGELFKRFKHMELSLEADRDFSDTLAGRLDALEQFNVGQVENFVNRIKMLEQNAVKLRGIVNRPYSRVESLEQNTISNRVTNLEDKPDE